MRFSFNWLKKHLATNLNINQIADMLTVIGLEVEELIDPEVIFKNFKLVRIESAEKHPNADKLKVCSVIAPNAHAGMVAVLALPGAYIPESKSVLKKSKIRGIESQGMMCSARELELDIDHPADGIIEFPGDMPLTNKVGDVLGFDGGILDLSITPNRGDCFSVKGIARDLAAAGAGEFIERPLERVPSDFALPITITHEHGDVFFQHAPQMSFRVIRDVTNQESPQWLKNALRSAGMNSISALVDIANYYMIDSGSPFQVYDLDKIQGHLNMRFAERNEKFVDFTGKEYLLKPDMLISEDDRKIPFCLLGIKSGDQIMCDENTKNILIEAALFDAVQISQTGICLNALSDSRTRFERGVDKNSCIRGLEEVSKIIIDTCGGSASKISTIGAQNFELNRIVLTKNKLKSVSGCDVEWNKVKVILNKLGLQILSEKNATTPDASATFLTPSWRYDLEIEEDLIEEVLRINGYHNVKELPLTPVTIRSDALADSIVKSQNLRKLLAFRKLSEVISYSFIKKEYADTFKEQSKPVRIVNAISLDFEIMRPSLIPSLLLIAQRSLKYGEDHISIFEVGNVFANSNEQATHISGLRAGSANPRNWRFSQKQFDVFDVKEDFYAILDFYGINTKNVRIDREVPSYYHPSRSGAVYQDKKLLGYFGELHPRVNKQFGITEPLECFEVLPIVTEIGRIRAKNYNDKVFPKIERDFAFVFDEKATVGELVNGIYKLDERITNVDIFDMFKIDVTQKSIGMTVVISSPVRTLTEEEAVEVSNKVVSYVEKFGGVLRQK